MMKYTIYRTTNIINNKIYIGKHQTKDLDDGYLGSGKILKRAISKYGEDKFESEILYIFKSKLEMDSMEAELIDEEFINREDTYTIKLGGEGGFDYINENILNNIKNVGGGGRATGKKLKEDKEFRKKRGIATRNNFKKAHLEGKIPYDNMKGKSHSEATKKQMRDSHKGKHTGEKNSQFGTCWIMNEKLKENKKIKKDDLQIWLNKGWKKGRKIKIYDPIA